MKMLVRFLYNMQKFCLGSIPYTRKCPAPDWFKMDKKYELRDSVTLDNSICKTKAHLLHNYPPHPERLPSTRPTACADWSNSWLPGEKTQGLPGRLVLLLMGTSCAILLIAAPAETTRLWPASNTWFFTMFTGILALWLALWIGLGHIMLERHRQYAISLRPEVSVSKTIQEVTTETTVFCFEWQQTKSLFVF